MDVSGPAITEHGLRYWAAQHRLHPLVHDFLRAIRQLSDVGIAYADADGWRIASAAVRLTGEERHSALVEGLGEVGAAHFSEYLDYRAVFVDPVRILFGKGLQPGTPLTSTAEGMLCGELVDRLQVELEHVKQRWGSVWPRSSGHANWMRQTGNAVRYVRSHLSMESTYGFVGQLLMISPDLTRHEQIVFTIGDVDL